MTEPPAFPPPPEPTPEPTPEPIPGQQPPAYPSYPAPPTPPYPTGQPYPNAAGQPGWYPPPPTGTNGFAIASLVFGIIGGCLLSIIFGIVALTKIKKTGQNGRGMAIAGLVLSGLWILLLGIGGVIALTTDADRDADGAITDGGNIFVEDLRVGDCANELDESESVLTVDGVPCAEPHTGEVVGLVPLAGGSFPGDDALSERAEEDCVDALEDYSTRAFDDESYSIYWIQPSADTWEDDDRTLICFATTEDARTGSIQD